MGGDLRRRHARARAPNATTPREVKVTSWVSDSPERCASQASSAVMAVMAAAGDLGEVPDEAGELANSAAAGGVAPHRAGDAALASLPDRAVGVTKKLRRRLLQPRCRVWKA